MITNNEAVQNFINGKRNLAAYQFNQLIKEHHSDEIAFNYAMVNLFTGCPQKASLIFGDLVKRYPRNPRLLLRYAESLLATKRSKMSEFGHVQQLDHLIQTKNKPILIKINPNYCQQQIQQFQRGTPSKSNFLAEVKSYLKKSLELINEYNDISLLTDDIPNTNQNSTLSQQLSFQNPYHSISRSGLYHLRIKVQLNLAYICLCMGEPVMALDYTTQCLKSSPSGYEKVLANLYHAEACILASRVDEAIQFLNLEVLNIAKSIPESDLATVITYNLGVAYAAKGEFDNAEKIIMRCFQPTKPTPMQIIICLLYIQLQKGQLESAKRTILSNLPQFR